MARPRKTREITIPSSIYQLQPVATYKGRNIYADNPFVGPERFALTVRNDLKLVAASVSININDQEQTTTGVIGRIQDVDTEQFVKIYTSNVACLFELNTTAQRTLIAVFMAVQRQAKDKSEIYLSYNEALQYYVELEYPENKIPSKKTFYRGLGLLINDGFLAAAARGEHWYWINPSIIFNGDRVRFVQEYRLTKRKKSIPSNQHTLPGIGNEQ